MQTLTMRILIGLGCILIISVAALLGWPEQFYTPYEPSDDYRAQAAQYNIPDMPDDWTASVFTVRDGTRLRWGQTDVPDNARASVVIVPGYTATLSMYGEQIEWLRDRGYHVIAIDMRGQGLSQRHRNDQPEKLWVEDFSTYSDDLAEFLRVHAHKDLPLILAGNSFGGHVTLRMAVDHPELADGLFLIAPAIQPKAGDMEYSTAFRFMALAQLFGKSQRYIPGGENWRPGHTDLGVAAIEHCSSNPDRLHARDVIFTREPAQRVGSPTNQWGAEFWRSTQYLTKGRRLESVSVPVMMIQADLDLFVENEAIEDGCERMQNCRAHKLEETGHCLFQESDAVIASIFDRLDQWTDEHFTAPTASSASSVDG